MAASRSAMLPDQFDELDVVRLRSIIYTDDAVFSTGALGTVVFRHPLGDAYEVEFAEPLAAVLTLRGADLDVAM